MSLRPLHLALAFGLLSCRPAPTQAPVATARPPRVVVLVVIDQLPSWSFDPQREALPGGIGRLLQSGAYWPKAAYPYATTNTAPGHATIGSGTTPSVHGIIANRWFDAARGTRVEVDDDPTAKVIDPRDGHLTDHGVSNHRLLAPGIADALHAASPRSRAVAIGWKSRAAITVLGQHPDVALWFDAQSGAMTSSTDFGTTLPPWVTAFAATTPGLGEDGLGEVWTPLDDRTAALAVHPDAEATEGDPYGLGNVFPHRPAQTKNPARAIGSTPRANTLLVDAAIAAIAGEQLGADDHPDVLAITFSPHDYAGHAWCQESWERVDHLRRIDRDLGRLFAALDAAVGHDGWSAVLTSDHGALPSRVRLEAEGKAGKFLLTDELVAAAEAAADGVLGPGDWVLGATTVELSMTAAFAARAPDDRDRALAAVVESLRALGLAWVERIDHDPARTCSADDDLAALVCRSIHAAHSGDVYFVGPQWGLVNDEEGECTAHGSPWSYDREVPIVVVGPGFAPGRRTEMPSMLQLAPTVTSLLGVPPPARASAAPLR